MTGRAFALLTLAALLGGVLVMPAAAPAQCRLCATPSTDLSGPAAEQAVRIEVQARLNFDQVVVLDNEGLGTARLAPDGSSSTSGSIGLISGRAMVGNVVVRGEPGRLVRINLPGEIALYGFGGGSIRLDSLVTDLPTQPRLDSQGSLQFRFGGALHVQGNVDGEFRGDVPITVDYL